MRFSRVYIFLFLFVTTVACKSTLEVPYDLTCEYLENPVGVDISTPRLRWKILGADKNDILKTYIWLSEDSFAVVNSNIENCWYKELPKNTFNIIYDGKPLKSYTKYYWKVQNIGSGKKIDSPPAISYFITGIISPDKWTAKWITDSHDRNYKPAAYYRKTFSVDQQVKSAYLIIAAGGLYELSLNDQRVGNHVLDPMFTRFDRRILSVMYDVSKQLNKGENVVGVELGNGWYNHQSTAVWFFDKAAWRNRPRFAAILRIEYENGNLQWVETDEGWLTNESPVIFNSIYTAEHFDARNIIENWNNTSFLPDNWTKVKITDSPTDKIVSQLLHPIKEIERLSCSKLHKINDTCYVYHFPKNIAGVVELTVQGDKGSVLKLKHGELLYPDGRVNTENIDYHFRPKDDTDPFQTDIVYLSGNIDVFKPKFNYKGFQYVEVTSSKPLTLNENSLTAISMHSDVPRKGKFNSSSTLLNKIWQATNSSYLANLFGYPTDCPQREKNGWTGDAHIAIETGLYNFDAITIYEKWMNDFLDEQKPNGVLPCIIPTSVWGYDWANGIDWTSAICIIPWNVYRFYGDTVLLKKMYPGMKKYLSHVESIAVDNLSEWGLGDWVPVSSKSDIRLTSSIYYYVATEILYKSALLFNYSDDARYYSVLSERIKNAINRVFLDENTGIYATGTQTELAMPLYWNIVPEEYRKIVATRLNERVVKNNYHLDVGLLGSKALLGALSNNGYIETAYKIATRETYPSWGYWIKNGATTLRENWRTEVVIDNSHNHIMFGEIGAWLFHSLAGIKIDESLPGFKHVLIEPFIPVDMDFLETSHDCPYGLISISWRKNKKGKISCSIEIPVGVTASFKNPLETTSQDVVKLSSGHHNLMLN